MPIAEMQKIEILGLKRQKRLVLDMFQEIGVVQLQEISEGEISLDREVSYDGTLSDLEFAISFLERYSDIKKSFIENFATSKERVSYHKIKACVSKLDFKELVNKCRYLENELINISELRKNLNRERETLLPWKGIKEPLSFLKDNKYVTYFTGTVSKEDIGELKKEISEENAEVDEINRDEQNSYIVVAATKGVAKEIEKKLSDFGFVSHKLPVSVRRPISELEKIEYSLNKADKREAAVKDQAKKLAVNRFDLMLVHDYFFQKKTSQDAEKKLELTRYTFVINGWIRRRHLKFIRKRLAAYFPETVINEIEPEEDEVSPVAIDNVSILRPFETVTNIYGTPSYKEVDPTPHLSAFFIIFFGLCLGDAGYGIALSLASYILYKKVGPTSSARKLLKLLMFGGFTTFLAGLTTGGWFGVQPSAMPEAISPIRDALLKIRIIDPVENPIGMLVVTLVFGIVQIIFGITVSFYEKAREKRYLDAVLDHGLWIYFLIVLIFFGLQKSKTLFVSSSLGYFVLGGIAALVLTQGRKEKNIVLKFGKGVLSLYNTVGYVSDTLSYSRILALGLATSIIAMVINMVALMTKDSVPVLGYIIMSVILVGGHIFNLVVNVLGSFIHSARLQFVEFFSKFMEGGGMEFTPFKRDAKFIEIDSQGE